MNAQSANAKVRRSKARFQTQTGDLEILRLLAEFHYVTAVNLQILTSRNIVSLRRRLRQLADMGFVRHLGLPPDVPLPTSVSPHERVHFLASRGLKLAIEYGFADEGTRVNDEKSSLLLPHDLGIANFHIVLALALRNHLTAELSLWEQRRSVLLDSVTAGGERFSVNPDALFSIRNMAMPASENTTCFFYEHVRARESEYSHRLARSKRESNVVRKIRGFEEYHRHGKDKEAWGMNNFRVIIEVPTKRRVHNLCRKLARENLNGNRFWFVTPDEYSMRRPGRILGNIFLTAKDFGDGKLYSLLTRTG